jgi:uncharacterized protein YjbI with pentapeptide repeats
MKFEIKHRFSGSVLFSLETESLKLCVEAAVTSGANLSGAYLTGADLRGANLKKIKGWDETPKLKNLNSRILKAIKKDGELEMGNWHKCNTTHCRGGWAVVLAGKKGKALEDKFGVFLAATLIYLKSTGRIPDFFATNRAAMADLKKCAKAEK